MGASGSCANILGIKIQGRIFCIITSLAFGGVVVLPRFLIVVESCGVVSIVESVGLHEVDERSAALGCLVPVCL